MKKKLLVLIPAALLALTGCTVNDLSGYTGGGGNTQQNDKVVSQIVGSNIPATIELNGELDLNTIDVEVTYTDGSTGYVHPTSIVLDTSVAGATEGTLFVGTQSTTFNITVTATTGGGGGGGGGSQTGTSFADVVAACKALADGATSEEVYTFDAKVSTSFAVKESSQTANTYQFNICADGCDDEMVAWWLSSTAKPNQGDEITVTSKLQKYVSGGNTKLEAVDGSFVIKGSTQGGGGTETGGGGTETGGGGTETGGGGTETGGGTGTTETEFLIQEITVETLGLNESAYQNFTSVLPNTGIVMEGNAKKKSSTENYIQIRSLGDNSGLYTRTSNRNIRKVEFTFAENPSDGRNITVYGTNGIYKTPSSEGTLLGTANGSSTIVNVSGDYRNISITAGGAIYLSSFKLYWSLTEQTSSVTDVTLNTNQTTINAGESETLTAFVEGLKPAQEVTWSSNNETVATVENGIVQAHNGGSAVITATSNQDPSVSASCNVTVANQSTLLCADFTTKASGSNSYSDSWDYDSKFTIVGGANNNKSWDYIKFGKKNGDSVNTITTKNAISSPVSIIKVEFPAGSLSKDGMTCTEWGVIVKSGGSQVAKVISSTPISKNAQIVQLTPSSGSAWDANCTYQIYFNCGNTTTTNGIVFVSKVSFIG